MYFWKSRIFEGKLLIKKQRMKKGKAARNKSRKKGKTIRNREPKKGKTVRNKGLILKISLDSESFSILRISFDF